MPERQAEIAVCISHNHILRPGSRVKWRCDQARSLDSSVSFLLSKIQLDLEVVRIAQINLDANWHVVQCYSASENPRHANVAQHQPCPGYDITRPSPWLGASELSSDVAGNACESTANGL